MADNAFVKIGTALLKHQVKKLVGEEAMGAIGEELAEIGGDKLDSWLGNKSTVEAIEKAATTARDLFRGKVNDDEVEQWMVMLPIHDLPTVLSAIEELPTSPDETKLENALRETIAQNWRKLSPEQVDNAVNSFLTCLRSALLPIEKQTLMVIGRSVLRIEDKVDQLTKLVEQLKPYSTRAQVESRFGNLTVGGSVGGNVTVGNNNVVNNNIINNYYQQEVKKNTEKHEPDYWELKHPYPMPPNFTGRIAERALLTHWLKEDTENHLFILRALGGFGKSALAWQWLTHDVEISEYPKVVFWSFYEGDASFEHFIGETLKYLKLEVPQGQRPQVDELLKAMQSQKILLIMDGFERALRAYNSMNAAYQGDEEAKKEDNERDCVNINAELFLKNICSLPSMRGKVLMTTRITPSAVEQRGQFLQGCIEKELEKMDKNDAVNFFHTQGITGTHGEIESACEPYGYHPLSLRILAGLIADDRETPGDIVIASQLDISDDIVANKNHVLKVAYNSLSPEQQRLLSTIACFRAPTTYDALKSIASIPSPSDGSTSPLERMQKGEILNRNLKTLETRGLVHRDRKTNKYDLHPIVRRYAYERLTKSNRAATHIHLCDYFSALDVSAKPQIIDDLAPIIELYHHTVRAGKYDDAFRLYNERLRNPLYYQFGAYELDLQLLLAIPRLSNGIPHLSSPSSQTWNLLYAVMCYERTGRLQSGLSLHKPVIHLNIDAGDKINLASAQIPFSMLSCDVGKLETATISIRESVEIFDEIGTTNWRGISHRSYGRVLMLCGDFEGAEKNFDLAHSIYTVYNSEYRFHHGLSVLYFYKGLLFLWQKRPQEAYECAQQARKFSLQDSLERENIGADWLVEVSLIEIFSHKLVDQRMIQPEIERNLTDILTRCRRINLVELEPDILLARARWYHLHGSPQEALKDTKDALVIANRCEYRLKQADINNFLAQLALEQEKDKSKAKQYAEEAKKLATCDGPPYYYKVAYEEAERFLEKLK